MGRSVTDYIGRLVHRETPRLPGSPGGGPPLPKEALQIASRFAESGGAGHRDESTSPPATDDALTPLDGLDEIPWADLEHAYGPATDVPVTLRALAAPGEDPEREERLFRLDTSIYHQGGAVYPAGAAAVPFLIELAATPGLPLRAEIVELIGSFAALQNEMGEPWRSAEHAVACREALVARHDKLVGLITDADDRVRTAATGLLWEYAPWSPRAHEVADALVVRDAVEPDLALRVSLRLDGARVAAEARRAGAPSAAALAAAVRHLAAAPAPAPAAAEPALRLACLAADRRLDPESATWRDLLDAALAPTTPHDIYTAWAEDGFRLARALCGMCGDHSTDHLNIVGALIGHDRARVRAGALQAAGDAMLRWRSATPALLPVIAATLLDPEPECRMMSADLLSAAGTLGVAFDDHLAVALEDPHRSVATRAAWALARHGDARAVPTLLHALDHQEKDGFGPSTHYSGGFYWFDRPPLREALVACAARHGSLLAPALRSALARSWAESRTGNRTRPRRRPHTPVELNAGALPRFHLLCDALEACGPAAAEALPELDALLTSTHPRLALTVIEAVGSAAARLAPHLDDVVRTTLRAAAAQIAARDATPTREAKPEAEPARRRVPGLADPWITALSAARTRFAVTGDEGALLRTVDEVLSLTAPLREDTKPDGEGAGHEGARSEPTRSAVGLLNAAMLAGALARCLAPLGPVAVDRLSWPEHWLRTNERWWASHEAVPVAWAHWRMTGDSALALRVFGRILSLDPGADYSRIQFAALRHVAEMGPGARELAPLLRRCLDRDERVTRGGGWRGIALDDDVRLLASTALTSMNIQH